MQELLRALSPGGELAVFTSVTVVRLVLAACLGGIIGLEREVKHKPAGLRTNLFICFGAAMFTILSDRLADQYGGDHTRIAAQIIPGIGFIGAGSILHSRGSVTGLTTAATLFVVASVGMAAGGGQYLAAIFATIVIFLALHALGWVEERFNLKPITMAYEVVGEQAEELFSEINRVLDEERRIMQTVQLSRSNGMFRVQFTLQGMRKELDAIFQKLRQSSVVKRIEEVGAPEPE